VGAVTYRYCIFSGGLFNRWEGDGKISRTLVTADLVGMGRIERDATRIVDTLGVNYDDEGQCPVNSPPINAIYSSSKRSNSTLMQTTLAESITFRSKQFAEWGRKSTIDGNLKPTDGVIIVAYFLPVILHRSRTGAWSATWDAENILSLNLEARATFVGSVRYHGAPIPVEEEEAVTIALMALNCHPIFINQTTHYQFYDIYCKQSLWLMMHHVADVYGPLNQAEIGAKGQQDLWFIYSTVNRIFRDKVVEVFQAGDLVWINGFHLMLLPSFLRRFLQVAKIGFFFHTPFPSSEIWRRMTRREDLLRGILAADQIGFHLYEYARHFLTTCHRLLGHTSEVNAAGALIVSVDGREVAITCIHVGVDMSRIQQALKSSHFESEMQDWRKRYTGKVVVAGIDKLERLKGIPLKLIAIEQFLIEEPQWRGKLIFSMIGISALERGEDYRQTQHDVKVTVGRINREYGDGGTIIYFEERSEKDIRLPQRLAFFAGSDVLMITPTRDGLNRLPMEFTLARNYAGQLPSAAATLKIEGAGLPNQGVAIVSEFISSARVMRGALIVNPWKAEEVKLALKQALIMSASDRVDRMRRNLEFSSRLTTINWAKEVLRDLKCVEKSSAPTDRLVLTYVCIYIYIYVHI
jgi:trehalose 6-phosphate synthase/phosphatase